MIIKTISLLQPWASLVVLGHKRIETRSWNTKHRGPLLIHASKKIPDWMKEDMKDEPFRGCIWPLFKGDAVDKRWEDALPTGAIIGQVNLIETRATPNPFTSLNGNWIHELSDQEIAFGDYSPGRYGWLLSKPVLFDEPIPVAGALSLWDFDMEKKQKVVKPKKQTTLFV